MLRQKLDVGRREKSKVKDTIETKKTKVQKNSRFFFTEGEKVLVYEKLEKNGRKGKL